AAPTAVVPPPPPAAPQVEARVTPPAPLPIESAAAGGWTVLANPTRSREDAEALERQLRGRGYDPTVVRVRRGGHPRARVRVRRASVGGGEKWGRYSCLGTERARIFRARGEAVEVETPGRGTVRQVTTDPFGALKALLAEYRPVAVPGVPRFAGGAVGYVGY